MYVYGELCGNVRVCVGSHWDRRIMDGDIMSPVSTAGAAVISPVTLALFEDSGWYTPNYTVAASYAKGPCPYRHRRSCNPHVYTQYQLQWRRIHVGNIR